MTTTTAAALITAGSAALMLTKPQGHNYMKLPSFRNVAEIRSSLPGRFRAYIPSVKRDPAAADDMRTKLVSTGAVRDVLVNPRTGNVLFLYDESLVEGAVVFGAALKLLGLDGEILKRPTAKLETGLNTIYEAVNFGILEATDGFLDCKTVAGGALTIAAARSLMMGAGLGVPGAMTLLWWASNIFRGNGR